jgi:hypothetical protein
LEISTTEGNNSSTMMENNHATKTILLLMVCATSEDWVVGKLTFPSSAAAPCDRKQHQCFNYKRNNMHDGA